jgi:hypothetical protein
VESRDALDAGSERASIGLSGSGPPDANVPVALRQLTVQVVDSSTGGALMGAELALTTDTDQELGSATTAGDGLATFAETPSFDVRLRVRCADYFPAVFAGPELAFRAAPAAEGPLVVALDPSGSLVVHVTDEESLPVAGAVVAVVPAIGEAAIPTGWPLLVMGASGADQDLGRPVVDPRTDGLGRLTVPGLPCGPEFLVRVSGPVTAAQRAARIDPKERRAVVEIRGRRGVRLTGRVLYRDGLPAAGVGVEVTPARAAGQALRIPTRTDESGRYELPAVVVGRAIIHPIAPSAPSIVVDARPPEARAPDIVIDRSVRIEGRVLLGGRGVEAGSCDLEAWRGPRLLGRSSIGEEGRFTLEVTPGALTVQVWLA